MQKNRKTVVYTQERTHHIYDCERVSTNCEAEDWIQVHIWRIDIYEF